MSVASHLGIRTADYDRQIATLIPAYAEMLDTAAAAAALSFDRPGPTVLLDLGIGSGALADRCLRHSPRTRVIGVDLDPAMLDRARRRLGRRLTAVLADVSVVAFPRCQAITASFALHHLRTPRVKTRVYRKACRALRRGGRLVTVDRYLADDADLDAADRAAWRQHLAQTYSGRRADAFLAAWADEDVYLPLGLELALMRRAGLRPDLIWRQGGFAVVAARGPA
jgi:ubiquinone/menaquinone biosynthesis C-methylase UbiE